MAKTTKPARSEQQRIYNLAPTPEQSTSTDWRFDDAHEAGLVAPSSVLPPSIDLRKPWWTIGDQGNSGSCVGWASTDGVARYMLVSAGRLAPKTKLSPRFTFMAAKETDNDTTWPQTMIENADVNPKPAMKVLRKYGAVPESLLPFKIRTEMYTGSQKAFYATAAQYRIAAYFNLKRDLNHWRSWLVEHGPIMAGVRIDATFHDAASTKGMLDTFQPDTIKGGHAVTVVGYTDAGRFILRNSWGTVWGDKGFAYASEDYINAAFFEESYGVTV